MIFLDVDDVKAIHAALIAQSGGASELLDRGQLESAVAQPRMTFGGDDLYPTLVDKAAALAFSLASNHAFRDGNKRIAHAAMATFLDVNGWRVTAEVDDEESVFLALADHRLSRSELTKWLACHVAPLETQ